MFISITIFQQCPSLQYFFAYFVVTVINNAHTGIHKVNIRNISCSYRCNTSFQYDNKPLNLTQLLPKCSRLYYAAEIMKFENVVMFYELKKMYFSFTNIIPNIIGELKLSFQIIPFFGSLEYLVIYIIFPNLRITQCTMC